MESLAAVAAAAAEPAAAEQAAAAPLPQSTQRRVGEIVLARSPGYTLWPAQVVCPTVVRARRAAMRAAAAWRLRGLCVRAPSSPA
jgi:hypothetical protein